MRLIFIGEVFFTHAPEEEFRSGVALENISHEPLAFLSGSFKGSQLRWVTVDKEGFTIVNTCLLYTSPSPRDGLLSRMPSSA